MYCNESIEWVIEMKPLRIHCQFWNILLAAIMKIIRVIQRWRMQMKNIWPVFIPNRFYCSLSLLEIGMEDYFFSFYEWILNTVRLTAELAETLLSCNCLEFSMILEANCVSCSEANWSQAQELMILDLFFFSCPIRCRLQLPWSKRYAHCTYQSMT